MTEKRFVERYAGRTTKKLIGIEDIETNRVCVTIEENIRLLNELNDENEQLKQEIEVLRDYGIELLEYINSPPKHRKSICDAVICFKNKKGDVE